MPRAAKGTKKIRNKNELPATPKKIPKRVAKSKPIKKEKVPKPFADGKLSSAAFFGMLRSCLRRKSMYWFSIQVVRKAAQIPYVGESKRMKYLYVCGDCKTAVPSTGGAVHHLVECGSLNSFEDLPEFTRKLFCNSDGLIFLCNFCHSLRHPKEIKQ